MYDYRAKLSDKIRTKGDDGDTILFWLDQGLNDAAEEPIRLIDVKAPESYQAGGLESAQMLRSMLDEVIDRAQSRRLRWPFMVFTQPNTNPEPDERRSFVRWAGTVYAFDATATGEPSINEQMAEFLASHPEWGNGITVPFKPRDDDNG